MSVFYDTHAHLDFPEFAHELPAILERAQTAGIEKIISIGTTLESSQRAVRLAEKYPQVYAAVGWHPSHVTEAPEEVRGLFQTLLAHPKVVAVGETGLDYHRLPSSQGGTAEEDAAYKVRQRVLFEQQMELAAEAGLNCVIHERDAFEDVFAALEPWSKRLRGVFHCYVNTPANMRRILGSGSLVSYTGILTFKNAQNVRDSLLATPDGQFMFETDCPFLAPVPFRGKRCEPAYVRDTATAAAGVRGCSLDYLSQVTCATAKEFFPKLGK